MVFVVRKAINLALDPLMCYSKYCITKVKGNPKPKSFTASFLNIGEAQKLEKTDLHMYHKEKLNAVLEEENYFNFFFT